MFDFTVTDDRAVLAHYSDENRIWQGIPSIEYTKGGKTYLCFYSGNVKETVGNYVLLYRSSNGDDFGEPIAAVLPCDGYRCYDPCLWVDPTGRLWFTWAQSPEKGQYAAICDDPDAEAPVFGEPFYIGNDVMMNKPTVLSTGDWLFPVAVWARFAAADGSVQTGSFAYASCDLGKTFENRGFSDVDRRTCDEHMFVEHGDRVTVYVRTSYGIATAHSYDGGHHWSGDECFMKGPSSRFFIRRMPSGRLLLIYHDETTQRNNLTAFLSEDEGKSWKYKLLLDERIGVSYPDATVSEDGAIRLTYDRERGCFRKSLAEALSAAREILTAKITETDIMAGKLVTEGSYLGRVVNKLTVYSGEDPNPYKEADRFSAAEFAAHLIATHEKADIPTVLFEKQGIRCDKLHHVDVEKLDALLQEFDAKETADASLLTQIVTEMRTASEETVSAEPIVSEIIRWIGNNLALEFSQQSIAAQFGISKFYLAHLFKKETGLGVIQFAGERRIATAKQLLCNTKQSIADIAAACGFSPSYFSETFKSHVGISPSEYRNLHSKGE